MNRKVGTIGRKAQGGPWTVEVIDYTNRAKEHSVGAFHLCPTELDRGRDYIKHLVAQKVYNFMVDVYGEDVSYVLDAEDF